MNNRKYTYKELIQELSLWYGGRTMIFLIFGAVMIAGIIGTSTTDIHKRVESSNTQTVYVPVNVNVPVSTVVPLKVTVE